MQRGAGPQGGEILFLCWLALFMWAVLISVSSAIAYVATHPGSGITRNFGIPLATAVATTVLCWIIAVLLNNASLSHITELQSRVQNWSAFLLYALLVTGNLWFLTRR
jgi:glycerol-3-phosphate acyltransferase PlsY